MFDEWVRNERTGECWRLDSDTSRAVYRSEAGGIIYRDGLRSMVNYRFFPCCPKDAPKNENIPETGAQMSIFDFLDEPEKPAAEKDPDRLEELRITYEERGYRPRIAEALARRDLGIENPDAFLLSKFNITGEDLR